MRWKFATNSAEAIFSRNSRPQFLIHASSNYFKWSENNIQLYFISDRGCVYWIELTVTDWLAIRAFLCSIRFSIDRMYNCALCGFVCETLSHISRIKFHRAAEFFALVAFSEITKLTKNISWAMGYPNFFVNAYQFPVGFLCFRACWIRPMKLSEAIVSSMAIDMLGRC